MAFRFFNEPASGDIGSDTYKPEKKGLFSILGNTMMEIGVGLKDPSALLQLQQQEEQANREFQMYLAQQREKRKAGEAEAAQQQFENRLKALNAGAFPQGQQNRTITTPDGQVFELPEQADSSLKEQLSLRKMMADVQEKELGQRLFEQFISGEKMNAPIGTTMTYGNLNVPLNPRMTDEEKRITSGAELVIPTIDSILEDINTGEVDSLVNQMRVDSGVPLVVQGDDTLERVQSNLNLLKARIPFDMGGKQLTPFEAGKLFVLLNTTGKSQDYIKRDLNRFKDSYEKLYKLATDGNISIGDFNKKKDSLLKSIVGNKKSESSGIDAEIDEINKRLKELGGE